METFTKQDKRTCYCGTLTSADIGKRVSVAGWAQRTRDLGSLIFIDLRDRTGIVQLAFDDKTDREVSTRLSASEQNMYSRLRALSAQEERVR